MATCQIGISIFNQSPEWIVQSVSSALSQEGNIDIFCTVRIDGPEGCDVQTLSWLNDICKVDDRLILIFGKNRIGTFASYKVIFGRLHTTYLCQLDADDWLEKDAISESVKVLKDSPSAPFVYTGYQEVNTQGKFISSGKRCKNSFSMLSELVEFSTFHLRVIQRWAYLRCGGYIPCFKYAGDYDLSLRLAELGQPEKVSKMLYNYRIHGLNTSISQRQLLLEEAFTISKSALSRRNLDHLYRLEFSKEKPHRHMLFRRMGPILLAGMHKSGTSILALIMQSFGVNIGSHLLHSKPNSTENPDGYGEDIHAINLNRLALTRLGLDPDWGEFTKYVSSENITNSNWRDLAQAYLASREESDTIWGWKDPRNSILLNEWMEVDSNLKVLATFRPPWDVIASFSRSKHKFYPKNAVKIAKMWCNFNQCILNFKKQYPSQCIVLPASLIINSPCKIIQILNTEWDQACLLDDSDSVTRACKLIRKDKFLTLDFSNERVRLFFSEVPQALDIYEELKSVSSF